MSDLKKIIANNIASLRKNRKLTQLELAEALNYSDKAISKWERAEAIPDITVLKQISDFFNINVDYLLKEHNFNDNIINRMKEKAEPYNKKVVAVLATFPVWIIATIIFFIIWITSNFTYYYWQIFIYSIPLNTIVLIIFNTIWGKPRANYYIISVLVWSIIISIYYIFFKYNLWLIFIFGIVAQIIIYLWSRVRPTNFN